jgi:hypothetical protein
MFVVIVGVALLLDATGAIGGKRLASHPVKERHAVVVPVRAAPPVRVHSRPVMRVHALPIATHSTTTSTAGAHTVPPASLPQAPGAAEAPLPPTTLSPVTTSATLPTAPLPSALLPTAPLPTVSASTHLSVPTGSATAGVQVAAGPTPALPDVLGVVTAKVDLHLRLG